MSDHPRAEDPVTPAADAADETPHARERAHAAVVANLLREHNKTLVRFLVTRLNSVAEATGWRRTSPSTACVGALPTAWWCRPSRRSSKRPKTFATDFGG
ncbi:hypothetical protein JN531_007530 [Flagellatimonas centrodinii]|uniref:hypothetical protein n=1 Tax=Flagellatimonas centrodinii TaxID=2806210 RepID=UPI001FFBC19A|nr:hypothetical protein [Flagellatimonas centrodinii]ULQ48141.1 hypothetical protein JN531_007530 [Flagellatimonas centrodinii]